MRELYLKEWDGGLGAWGLRLGGDPSLKTQDPSLALFLDQMPRDDLRAAAAPGQFGVDVLLEQPELSSRPVRPVLNSWFGELVGIK